MFEVLVVVALAVPLESLRLEDWLRPGTEVRATGIRAGDSLACQERARALNARPLADGHMGYFCRRAS